MPTTDKYAPITEAENWFQGTDRRLVFHVKDANGVPVDVATFGLSWMLKKRREDADAAAVLAKTIGGSGIAVVGTYNADPSANAQRVHVTILAADTALVRARTYVHELKRTDTGLKDILADGEAVLQASVHRT